MFISFEGIDGSGKSTQAKLLAEKLEKEKYPILFIREPGGTEISEKIREILLDKKHLGMNHITELFLFVASRSQLVSQIIIPALQNSKIVICDRYADSTTAYQGYGRGLSLHDVHTINTLATFGITPHISFLIDISIDEALQRQHTAPLDRIENSDRKFYERVRNGYLSIAEKENKRFIILNGEKNMNTLHTEVWSYIKKQLP